VVVAVAREVGVALAVDVALALEVDLAVDVALALDVGLSVGVALAEVLPDVPDEGEGVLDAPSEAELETVGLGVKTDGDGVGGPPPEQAATVTARTAVVTGTFRRTFMKPPVTASGQWRRPTPLSMCHPDRQRKRERRNDLPPFRSADIIPGADGWGDRIDSHI
jgi:hypothetical protein